MWLVGWMKSPQETKPGLSFRSQNEKSRAEQGFPKCDNLTKTEARFQRGQSSIQYIFYTYGLVAQIPVPKAHGYGGIRNSYMWTQGICGV